MRVKRSAVAIAPAFAALLSAVAVPRAAAAGSLSDEVSLANAQAPSLRDRVSDASSQYLRPEDALRRASLSSSMPNARYLHSVGEWGAVTALLLEHVEVETGAGPGELEEATYLLADAMFHARNFAASRRYLERLRPSGRYGLFATQRLLEIAMTLRMNEQVIELNEELERYASSSAEGQSVSYVRGRALHYSGDDAGAAAALAAVGTSSPNYDRARYLIGVSQTRLGNLVAARPEFESLIDRLGSSTSAVDVDLVHLSWLALGRLSYEERDWRAALDAYTSVPRQSRRYPDALYELSWAQIQQGNETLENDELQAQYYRTALNNLQLLTVLARPSSRHMVEAQLVRGDLLMRLARYDEAVREFQSVVDAYFPVEVEMRSIAARQADPQDFFEAIVSPQAGTLRLPELARPWLFTDPELERAMGSISDVHTLDEELDSARGLLARLDAVLNTGARVNAFPRSREGWGRVMEVQAQVTAIATAIAEAAEREARGLDAGAAQEYARIRDQRALIGSRLGAQPATLEAYDAREREVSAEFTEQLLDLHRNELDLISQLHNLEALRQMYHAGRFPTQEAPELWTARFESEERAIEAQIGEVHRVRDEVRVRQVSVALGDGVNATHRSARVAYLDAIEQELAYLSQRGGGSVDSARQALAALRGVNAACEEFYAALDRLLVEQTVALRDAVERERAMIEQAADDLESTRTLAYGTAGEVARAAFSDVHARFSDVTLRASLGVINVAWYQKEVLTDEIEALFDERNQQIRELDADFAELLEEK